MTDTEKRLFKQAIIKEYKTKFEKSQKKSPFNDILVQMRTYAPINIMLGVVASIFLVLFTDLQTLIILILSGVIWITIISTALSALSKMY